jgi:alcohol dehydrogenase (cytochrome c)
LTSPGTSLGAVRSLVVAACIAVVLCGHATAATEAPSIPTYTSEQAAAGSAVFARSCASCHGEKAMGGAAPALAGASFLNKWAGKPVFQLYTRMRTSMPLNAPGSLDEAEYTSLLAYIFERNNLLPGSEPLSAQPASMKAMVVPAHSFSANEMSINQLEAGIVMPPPPEVPANPLDRITPVTAAMLSNPPEGDWLTWRRTTDALGYSPLAGITKANVGELRLAWAWALPNGPNESTPLVHDGVLFVLGFGGVVQALNAVTGDLLWEYGGGGAPKNGGAIEPFVKKAMAIFGNRLYVATPDAHVISLDVKSGELVWDTPIPPVGLMMTGGPLIAKGKVIIGTGNPGGVVALDAETGAVVWRFKTIPGPGERGGNTWNDLAAEKRTGANVWTPGSYDAELDLVFFGTGQTYDTAPLRERRKGTASNNDALYTDTTLALDPDTGRLVWYFQHQANDQWDMDWAFERQILTLPVRGKMTKVVVTAGKSAIHDVLDARTGKYLYSFDLGLQNFVTAINPRTGAKSYDLNLVPGGGKTIFVCPFSEGAKNWPPSSVNPDTKVLFAPLDEACMYMTPAPGERTLLSTGDRISLSPRKAGDGLYGRLQAIDLATGKTLWMRRERAPRTSGVMATAGGLVFAGSLDRVFAAYDDATGRKLWSSRLDEVLNSSPISYAADGKQYVAVVLGLGGYHTLFYEPLVPEIRNPANRSSSIWVFALPDRSP